MTTTAGNGPFPSGTHTNSFISSPSTLMLSQNGAMAQPSSNGTYVCLGNIGDYFFLRDSAASMGRGTMGVNRNVSHPRYLIPGGCFTLQCFSGKIFPPQCTRTRKPGLRIHRSLRP